MTEPFTNLDANQIDEQIDQILQTIPDQPDDEESRYLRDLSYLYRKEEILARAHQRLMIGNLPDQAPTKGSQRASSRGEEQVSLTMFSQPQAPGVRKAFSWPKIVAVLAAALLLIGAIVGTTSFFSIRTQQSLGSGHKGSDATATPTSTVLFADPLSQNIHGWPLSNNSGISQYIFENGAYHIINQSTNATMALEQQDFTETALSYQITMQEIKGNDSLPANTFGVILNYHQQTVNGEVVAMFYTFEVRNESGNYQYNFYKYNGNFNSANQSTPWTPLGSLNAPGKEFHGGHDANAANTIKVVDDGGSFTFYVNGQQVGTARDTSLQPGKMGMLVNLRGTEVAFSHMLITRP